MYIIKVLIEYKNINLSQTFDYYYNHKIDLYTRVLVSFNNREVIGFVVGGEDYRKVDYEMKEIIDVIDDQPLINDELYTLAGFIEKRYLVSKMYALQTMLPNGMKPASKDKRISNLELHYEITNSDEKISTIQRDILDILKRRNSLKRRELVKEFGVYNINTLVKKNYLKKVMKDKDRIIVNEKYSKLKPLSKAQEEIFQKIINKSNSSFLLHGITGSGKTQIYLHLADYYLKQGKSVLVLVPEITLTLMMQEQFASAFSNKIAILHSRLTNSLRYQEYLKIKNGEVKIVVGTRSSIFAPLENIGLIILDEEHDSSYKQNSSLMYRTDVIADNRARENNANLLLASATPKISSLTKAYKKQYDYLVLNQRYQDKALPKVSIIDLNKERLTTISNKTISEIKNYLNIGKQVIVLLNRRGYNTMVSCSECFQTMMCPSCNVALTYHNASKTLRCHHCEYQTSQINRCLYCGSTNIKRLGTGIQKIEEFLLKELNNYQIIRIDQDNANNISKLEKYIKAFNNREAQVLIGTQMIAKGLNFEAVDLVVVLNIDASLALNTYNANENAFQLLVQVAGRAGRFSGEGKVLIETWQPEHYIFEKLRNNDYLGFYEIEMKNRKKFQLPPYYNIALLTLSSRDEALLNKETINLFNYLKDKLKKQIISNDNTIIYKVANVYRQQIMIKYKYLEDIREEMLRLKKVYSNKKDINLTIDTDY